MCGVVFSSQQTKLMWEICSIVPLPHFQFEKKARSHLFIDEKKRPTPSCLGKIHTQRFDTLGINVWCDDLLFEYSMSQFKFAYRVTRRPISDNWLFGKVVALFSSRFYLNFIIFCTNLEVTCYAFFTIIRNSD